MSHSDEEYSSHRLNYIKSLTPPYLAELLTKFGSAAAAIQAGPQSWAEVFKEDRVLEWIESEFFASLREADEDWDLIQKEKIRIYIRHSGPYPLLLKEISAPPLILYVRGDDICEHPMALAVVGSRRCSYYGQKMAGEISRDLARLDIVTVSGLARGIDSVVHEETLKMGGRTWAVLGCGLARCYPPENRKLFDSIAEQGAVISEFPLRKMPFPGNFPRRNRIIAGLTHGTVVVEGTVKSGSLITARLAVGEGRSVFAVPGQVTSPLSGASHYLIQQGAKLIQSVGDIAEELPAPWPEKWQVLQKAPPQNQPNFPPEVKAILNFLEEGPLPKEILAQRLSSPGMELAPLLFEMEIQGLVRVLPGGLLTRG